jgi:hypothetical protein
MEVSYVEGVANHNDPESWGAAGEGGDESLTGERTGRVFVAKRSGTPMTLNFDKPMAWALVAVPSQ